jgi:DNA-binding IclR family transcriptional regulator
VTRRMAPRSDIQCVARALRLMELLASQPRGIALTLAAERVGLHVVTTHRLLSTLMANGYVTQSEKTGRYRLSADAILLPQVQCQNTSGASLPGECPLPAAEKGGRR